MRVRECLLFTLSKTSRTCLTNQIKLLISKRSQSEPSQQAAKVMRLVGWINKLLWLRLTVGFLHMVNVHGHITKHVGKRPGSPDSFAPKVQESIDILTSWWHDKQRVLVLTGAGMSTEAGIPDYRGHKGSFFEGHKPIVHDQFVKSHYQRQRYWGRGLIGWKHMETRTPASGHRALASLERLGKIGVDFVDHPDFYKNADDHLFGASAERRVSVITQNVDSLHKRAGTWHSIDLHGRLDEVVCMSCGAIISRSLFQQQLEEINDDWVQRMQASSEITLRADGDAEGARDYDSICIPECSNCGRGILKPNVVFFGDTVPKHRALRCRAAVEACDGLLVVGSSLAVHSAFRHIRSLHHRGVDIAILNVGETRAETEGIPVVKVEAPVGQTLQGVVDAFS